MPSLNLSIRHLPGNAGNILDAKSLPENTVVLNPSIAPPILYLRTIKHNKNDEQNSAILYNLEKKETYHIDSPWGDLKPNVNLYKGIEDLRITWYKNTLWFAGTCTHCSDDMTSALVIGYFNKNTSKIEKISNVDIGSLPVKNMTLYVFEDKLYMLDIYLKNIYEITEGIDEKTKKFSKFVATKCMPLICGQGISIEGLRGSTSAIHLHGNTFCVIIHDIIFNDQTSLVTRLSYLHLYMEFDAKRGIVTFLSSPFWIANWGIEYCSGFTIHPDKNTVDLYLGVNDQQAISYKTTLHDLRCGK